ncbi:MAG: hypothetical protein LC118_03830 [Dehalococcoidia bacterium]|nr:hypothetical protein [Dehalococcoidia bacterium]
MTTKETLHELIDNLSDEEAAGLLARVRQEMARTVPSGVGERGKSVLEIFEEAWRNMSREDLEDWPSSDDVDEVVYRLHGD